MSFRLDPYGDNVILRSPEFTNTYRIDRNDINRTSRSGIIKVYVDATWPELITHSYRFTVIKEAIIAALKTFLETNAGLEITIIDHLGATYTGFITTPVNEIIYTRNPCSHDVSFEFLVTPIP